MKKQWNPSSNMLKHFVTKHIQIGFFGNNQKNNHFQFLLTACYQTKMNKQTLSNFDYLGPKMYHLPLI